VVDAKLDGEIGENKEVSGQLQRAWSVHSACFRLEKLIMRKMLRLCLLCHGRLSDFSEAGNIISAE